MRILRSLPILAILFFAFNSCQKEYSLENGNITTVPGTWEFRDSNTLYRGNMDTGFVETFGTTKTLTLQGTSFDGLEDFNLVLSTSAASFTTGTYMASNAEAIFEYSKNNVLLYEANQLNGEFIVTISSISATTVTGTFTGFAKDSAQRLKTITAGKFTTRYNNGSSSGNAIGTLGSTAGVCQPTTMSGTYTQGVPLDATNKAQVTVNVTTAGVYNISTNVVNGVSFTGSGSFTSTGTQTVDLVGSGTPVNSGSFNYTVTFGTSTCSFPVTYSVAAPPSTGTLGGGPGACTPATPAGTYTQGTALTSANTVTVSATVTTAGSYTISTNTVNGVSFTKSGVFTAPGTQNVTLIGSGTPTAAGAQTFTVTYGTSSCTFTITFAPGTTPPTGDYFPTTVGSNWVYYAVNGFIFSDSSKTTVTNLSFSYGGNTYTRFHTVDLDPAFPGTDTTYYRKTTNNYFQFLDVSDIFSYDAATYYDVNFLRDNVATGGSWTQGVTGSFNGFAFPGTLKFTVLAKGVAATVNGISFPDVIKIKTEAYYNVAPGTILATAEQWYARGVGIIFTDLGVDQNEVKRYTIL